ncbi:MAG: DUF3822 family protein [Bacteroidales bacterium]|nr:DUF3822 family protein [Bacteroidales bacterium]
MFTLVPSHFFSPATAREALAEVADLKEDEIIGHLNLPQYDAVLVYTLGEDSVVVDGLPEIYRLLKQLPDCPEYNKILCSLCGGQLFLAVAQGKNLLLANSFPVQDFTTAEYYIFLSMKSLQLNPEISTICWRTGLEQEDEMSLYRYFKAVVNL